MTIDRDRELLQFAVEMGAMPPDLADMCRERAAEESVPWTDLAVEEGLLTQGDIARLRARMEGHGEDVSDVETVFPSAAPANARDTSEVETIVSDSRKTDLIDGHELATMPSGSDEASALAKRNWGHYDFVRFLGKGGMGHVFQAFDNHLRRQVAIKTLSADDPTRVHRFIQEARAQARVEHDHICRIHEVNESEGRPYIVMQLIRGETLTQLTDSLSLEQKLLVIKQVAEALHEAHRAGLIHRDLKPGNIMVERAEDGHLKPFVLDFGLARIQAEPSSTVEGSFMGTPGYMAPEQVRGDIANLDRRTDVYGLGATLYHVLSGAPPFGSSTQPAVLVDILEKDPASLRPKGIPGDVDTVVCKCLEKDPSHRYDSAKALAEDLGRYLDGDPILARPPRPLDRLRKFARKNRAAVWVGGIAAVLLTAALAWGAVTTYRAGVRERLARAFTEKAEEIEALARYSHMSRRHDIRPDREKMRTRMRWIEAEMSRIGGLARAPAHYALGRGYLSFEDYDAALENLTAAWDKGYREPEVAYALVRVLSQMYRRELLDVRLIQEPSERVRREAELNVRYRQPALSYMEYCRDLDLEAPEYLVALEAFNQKRYEDTAAILKETQARLPWFYEAPKLKGEAHLTLAQEYAAEGNQDAARAEIDKALASLNDAATTAASDPAIYRFLGHAHILVMVSKLYTGEDLAPVLQAGLEQANNALFVFPGDPASLIVKSRLHWRVAQQQFIAAEDPNQQLNEAETAASAALEAGESDAWLHLGHIHSIRGQWQRQKGLPYDESFRQAVSALEKVDPSEQDYSHILVLGLSYRFLAGFESSQGLDATTSYDNAIDAYRRAIAIQPKNFAAYQNLGDCLIARSRGEQPETAVSSLKQAVEAFQTAKSLNKQHPVPYYYLGRAYLALAQDGDPSRVDLNEKAERALAEYGEGRVVNPNLPHFYSGELEIHVLQARNAWRRNDDPRPYFEKAKTIFEAGIEQNDKFHFLYINMAWAAYYQGKFLVRQGKGPEGFLQQAIELSEKALALAWSAGSTLCVGSANRLLAEHAMRTGQDPSRFMDAARSAFEEILGRVPDHAEAHRSLGRLATFTAAWHIQMDDDPSAAFDAAESYLAKALDINDRNSEFHLAEARRYLWIAIWERLRDGQAKSATIQQGRQTLERALAVYPEERQVPIFKAVFDYVEKQDEASDQDSLAAAMVKHPLLAAEWAYLPGFLTRE